MEITCEPIVDKAEKLSPVKRALLERRLKQQNRLTSQEPIPRRDVSQPAMLSYAQELLWLQDQLTPGPAYNVPRALRLTGNLNVEALKSTLFEVVRRHEVLRTRFITLDGAPVQIIDEGVLPEFEVVDLKAVPAAEREQRTAHLIRERANRVFDLANDLLLRTTLFCLGPEDHILLLMTHHIASDGWSRDILFRELSELYDAYRSGRPAQLPELPIQYADFAAWQREVMEGYTLKAQLQYWKEQLAGAPALIGLPTDYQRPPVQTSRGARTLRSLLTTEELRQLKALGQQESATLFMTSLACTMVFLHRHTGQEDLVMGTPIAGRSRTEIENLLGYFTNTLVLRVRLTGEMTFREVLREVRRVSLGAFGNQDLPYAKLVAELNPERSLAYNPVFQVLFGYGQIPPPPFALSDLTSAPFQIDREMAKFDLTIAASEVADGLIGSIEFRADLFAPETIDRMLERLETLYRSVMTDADIPISTLPMMSEAEREQVLVAWNGTAVEYSPAAHLPELFEAQVERTPDAVALEFLGRRLTYAELNRRANQLAHHLRECGVGPEVPVGILMERSPRLIIGLLGIHKAGGAYVPLDDNYPPERILAILKSSRAPVVVTEQSQEENLAGYDGRIVNLDREAKPLRSQNTNNPAHTIGPDNLAYVMFTSGSTGQPKGIAVPHSCLVHYVRAATDAYGVQPNDRVLQFASICFDTSIEEIFPCLTVGATLVVRNQGMLDSLATFWQRTADWGITFLSLPTAFWHELARSIAEHSHMIPAELRLIVIGGEKARGDRLELWRRYAGQRVQILNTYGPTETTVVATACDITSLACGEIPIGRPLRNVRVYLLDETGRPVPRGVTGELHIGGAGVARGYIHDPERTAISFIPDPFVPGGHLYRTGDLGRYRPDGNIEFLGRRDNQLKLRGFRIELGEIESVLLQHPAVHEAVVLAPEVAGNERQIVAYLSPVPGKEMAVGELRSYLQSHLPDYMVPSSYTILPDLPKTPGGKVDRRALPAPNLAEPEETRDEEREEPHSPDEEPLARLWQEVLGRNGIGVHTNFFDLGGHSLLAIRLLSEVKKEMGASVTLAEMLKAPTVREMARLIHRKGEGSHSWSPLVVLQPEGDKPPLFCAPVGGGSAFYYRTLATYIGQDQPLYLFEPIGMNGVDEPHETVEELAAYYLEHLRKVQPHGPYSLCGLSFGGIVAFEMARQLTAVGERIACLILFDTWAPGFPIVSREPLLNNLRLSVLRLGYKTGSYLENLNAWPSMENKLRYVRSRLQKRVRELTTGKPLKAPYQNPLSQQFPESFRKVQQAERRARDRYRPERYSGRILLLRARLQKPGLDVEPTLGWRTLADDVEVIKTPGTHFSLLEEPCVRLTVVHVLKVLVDARREIML